MKGKPKVKFNYYRDVWRPMTRAHYKRLGWYSVEGRRLSLTEALDFHGDCEIHYAGELIRAYRPSMLAHGGVT